MAAGPQIVQWRGGPAEESDVFVGRVKEITVNTTTWEMCLHDGVTPGGHRLGASGPPPEHRINEDATLQFKDPDGSWGTPIDLTSLTTDTQVALIEAKGTEQVGLVEAASEEATTSATAAADSATEVAGVVTQTTALRDEVIILRDEAEAAAGNLTAQKHPEYLPKGTEYIDLPFMVDALTRNYSVEIGGIGQVHTSITPVTALNVEMTSGQCNRLKLGGPLEADEWVQVTTANTDALGTVGTAATKMVGTGPDEIPQNSDLGDAAYKTVGETIGNVMGVGAFGLGVPKLYTGDLNDLTTPGLYFIAASATNTTGRDGSILVMSNGETGALQRVTQLTLEWTGTNAMQRRVMVLGVWQAWTKVYDQQTVLGTVSQVGGVPTGAIIERGSNANGEYVRWADGTQIATRTYSQLWAVGGNIVTIPLPTEFTSFATIVEWGTAVGAFNKSGSVPSGNSDIVVSINMNTADTRLIYIYAIGRWY